MCVVLMCHCCMLSCDMALFWEWSSSVALWPLPLGVGAWIMDDVRSSIVLVKLDGTLRSTAMEYGDCTKLVAGN
jgi:hypothetical protein